MTAKLWIEKNPGKKGNIRHEANINQLLVLVNMGSYNAILIERGKSQPKRLILIRDSVTKKLETLGFISTNALPKLGKRSDS